MHTQLPILSAFSACPLPLHTDMAPMASNVTLTPYITPESSSMLWAEANDWLS